MKDIEKVGADENEATTEEVERVLSYLQERYKDNDGRVFKFLMFLYSSAIHVWSTEELIPKFFFHEQFIYKWY